MHHFANYYDFMGVLNNVLKLDEYKVIPQVLQAFFAMSTCIHVSALKICLQAEGIINEG
jgi:hypothetical protein